MNYEKVHKEAYKKQLQELGHKVVTTIHVWGLANHMNKEKDANHFEENEGVDSI